jgi:superfamily II DNA/RNA helicase
LLSNIKKLGFKIPKPIQMQAIPIGFENKDMVAIAPTG